MSYRRISELIEMSKGGDKDSLEELIKTYDKLIIRYKNQYFVNGLDDDDLVQIARMAIVKGVMKFDTKNGANFTGFINIVLRNTFTTLINKKENTVYTTSLNKLIFEDEHCEKEYLEVIPDDVDIEDETVEKEDRLALRKALMGFTEEERELLIMCFSGHGKLKEYSRIKGISYRTCIGRRDRLMERLRRVLNCRVV